MILGKYLAIIIRFGDLGSAIIAASRSSAEGSNLVSRDSYSLLQLVNYVVTLR